MPSITTVICTHSERRWDYLESALRSVAEQDRAPEEIVLVVDHNPPLLERARTSFPDAVVLANRHESGLAGSRNTAVDAASGAVTAFLDDDAAAAPDWLRHLAAPFDRPEIVGVGGAVEPLWPSSRPGWFPEEFDWVVGCTHRGMPSEPEVVRNFVGANMAFLRDSLAEVRFFSGIGHSGGKPLGGSDPDICIRVSERWPERLLWYEPAARVFHHVSEERTTWRYFARRCINEGVSKALLTARVGARTGLSSEREYVRVTLPRAIRRSLQESVERRDATPLGEAAAIVAGLGLTGAGYAAGLVRNAFR